MDHLVEDYYNQEVQREWEREDRHRTEFAVTRRLLADYLPAAPARVLDVGGGPGRYSLWLAAKGYQVTLFDLAEGNLAFARQKAVEQNLPLEAVHGNALDMHTFEAEIFDVVLLMGPLYHLPVRAERERAVQQGLRVLRKGGLLATAFISRYAVFRDAAVKFQDLPFRRADEAETILTQGINDAEEGFTKAYFAHPLEIQPMMESAGVCTLGLFGVEGIVGGLESGVNQLSGELWQAWEDLNYRFAHDPILLGATDHLLYVGRKPG